MSLQWQSERVMHDESGEHEIKSCNSKMRLVKSDSEICVAMQQVSYDVKCQVVVKYIHILNGGLCNNNNNNNTAFV